MKEETIEKLIEFVEIEENTFQELKNNFEIEISEKENKNYEINISSLDEEDFIDLANEISAYHENPNEYFIFMRKSWNTNKPITIKTYSLEY